MLLMVCFLLIQKLLLTLVVAFHGSRQRRKIVANREHIWSLPIHYRIDPQVDRRLVKHSLSLWEQATCVRFVEVSNEWPQQSQVNNILNFVDSDGCYSNVGYESGDGDRIISLSLQCATVGVLLHEIGHALGLWHEQNRSDREKYIKIQYESILPGWTHDFKIRDSLANYGIPYDYGSIMHYSAEAFAKDGQRTIIPVDINYEQTIGQRDQISFYDAALINGAYCPGQCDRVSFMVPICQNDGYVNPAMCTSCACPTGFRGRYCERVRTEYHCLPFDLKATEQWKKLTWNGPGNCTWIIRAEHGQKLEIAIIRLDMTVVDSPTCSLEYVEIKYYLDIRISGARFCHRGPEKPITSETNRIIVMYYGQRGSFTLAYRLAHK